MVQETKTTSNCSRCGEKSTKASEKIDYEKLYEKMNADVPVYTDIRGNIHVNKEYAEKFPQLVQTLVSAEIEKNKNKPQYSQNYSYYNHVEEDDKKCSCEKLHNESPRFREITDAEFYNIIDKIFR